jgi:hypothetical protein
VFFTQALQLVGSEKKLEVVLTLDFEGMEG